MSRVGINKSFTVTHTLLLLSCVPQAQRGYRTTPITPWENNNRAAGAGRSTSNSSSSQTSSSGRGSSAPWVPGKKGRLFARRSGGSGSNRGGSSGDGGLEPLQDLIPPEVARARLQVCVCVYCIVCVLCFCVSTVCMCVCVSGRRGSGERGKRGQRSGREDGDKFGPPVCVRLQQHRAAAADGGVCGCTGTEFSKHGTLLSCSCSVFHTALSICLWHAHRTCTTHTHTPAPTCPFICTPLAFLLPSYTG